MMAVHRLKGIAPLRVVGMAVLALVAMLFAAAPSNAAGYTFSFTGKVTSASDVFPILGVSAGDPVSGSLTFDPLNATTSSGLPSSKTFNQSSSTFTFHVTHTGAPNAVDLTHGGSGGGSVVSENFGIAQALTFRSDGSDSFLSLHFETSPVGPPLTSLAGLPNTIAGLFALLGGASGHVAEGDFTLNGFGQISFDLTLAQTPIPAALPLFVTALAGLGFGVVRRRRSAREAA